MLGYRPFSMVFTVFPSSRPPAAAIQKSRALSPAMDSGQTTPRRQALPSGQRQPNGFSCEQCPSPPDVPRPQCAAAGQRPLGWKSVASFRSALRKLTAPRRPPAPCAPRCVAALFRSPAPAKAPPWLRAPFYQSQREHFRCKGMSSPESHTCQQEG